MGDSEKLIGIQSSFGLIAGPSLQQSGTPTEGETRLSETGLSRAISGPK